MLKQAFWILWCIITLVARTVAEAVRGAFGGKPKGA